MKKDTRNSSVRALTYAHKMKAAGYKQVSFFLSPAAHAALTELTSESRMINASLAATNNLLLESLQNKNYVFKSITNSGDPHEMVAAIDKTIKFLQKIRKENEEWIAAENAEFEARLEHIGHEAYQEEQESQAQREIDENDRAYQELVKSGKIK